MTKLALYKLADWILSLDSRGRSWLKQSAEAMNARQVGLIVFEQIAADELTGPAEVFSRANIPSNDGRELRCYQVSTLGISTAACLTDCGLIVKPQLDIGNAPPLDTVIIPGGTGIHDPKLSKRIAKWLGQRAPVTRRIAALGDSIYALAATGLLDGCQVAAHWRFAKNLGLKFPRLRVSSNCLFLKNGPFYTCAGGASSVDLCLSLVEEDYGRQPALKLARELIVHVKRSGEQQQYSEALQFQVQSCDRFADIATWILCNLDQDLSVEALARRGCMSLRNFTRLFKAEFGKAPAEFVAGARIAEARRRLEVPRYNIDSIATSLGFRSADVFSRAFEREIGCRPSAYRALLGIHAEDEFSKQPCKRLSTLLARA